MEAAGYRARELKTPLIRFNGAGSTDDKRAVFTTLPTPDTTHTCQPDATKGKKSRAGFPHVGINTDKRSFWPKLRKEASPAMRKIPAKRASPDDLRPGQDMRLSRKAHPYGLAMTALRPMQQRFVEAWIENPGFRPTQLLRLAGHRGTDWACARTSYNWARDPKILEAIREGSAVRLARVVPKALAALEVMIDDPNSRFHQKAVEGVLNRTGFHEIKETKQTVEHTVNTGELIAQIKARLERLGLALPAPTVQDGDVVGATVINGGD